MTRSCSVRAYERSVPSRPIVEQAMLLSLAAETGRICPVEIEPRNMDQVIEAAFELDMLAFGPEAF